MTAKKEWTRNRGKQPVGDGVIIEVRFRNGEISLPATASGWCWSMDRREYDIMAWRRVSAPRKPAAIAPEHAPRPAVPEAKPAPEPMDWQRERMRGMQNAWPYYEKTEEPERLHDAPRRPRLMHAVLATIVAVGLIGAVCYVF